MSLTPRQRFPRFFDSAPVYAITPEHPQTSQPDHKWLQDIDTVLQNGVKILQFRDKTSSPLQRKHLAQKVQALCKLHDSILIINDDLALAQTIQADGLHLGQGDGCLRTARAQLGPDALIGASCYQDLSLAEQAIASDVDYIAFGACFPSKTKTQAPTNALATISVAKLKYFCPVVAIGGITVENCTRVRDAGADMCAVIDGLFGQNAIAATTRQLLSCCRTSHCS